jgi:hypothetical protein
VGRSVQFIEMQATSFRPDVWRCFYDLIDTEFPSGWGIDLWFYEYCIGGKRVENATMAIIDTMHVQHNPFNLPSTHVGEDPQLQVRNWKSLKGIQLKERYPGDLGLIYYHPE